MILPSYIFYNFKKYLLFILRLGLKKKKSSFGVSGADPNLRKPIIPSGSALVLYSKLEIIYIFNLSAGVWTVPCQRS